ncbi:MAG TPA: sulfite exporter TauE/SafE family protein [Acidimicrobiia bacterium]
MRYLSITSRGAAGALAIGIAAGVLSGLFGVGGGIVIVPGLALLLGMDQRLAHGTSLAAILPIAAAALIGYSLDGHVDWPVAGSLIAGSVVGASFGTHWLHRLPTRYLQLGFALLLVLAAIRLFVSIEPTGPEVALSLRTVFELALVGLGSGILAGLMGVGGGVIMVPVMVILFGIPDAVAKGTSLVVILPTALVGTGRNLANRNVDLRTGLTVGAVGVVAAFVASRVSVGLEPRLSQALFAVLLLSTAVQLAIRSFRRND